MLRSRALAPWLLAAACAPHEAPEAPQSPTPVTPTADAPDEQTTWAWRADGSEPAAPQYLLGVVGQRGTLHCDDGGVEQEWRDVSPTIGRVGVGGPPDAALEPLMDQPVLAIGRPGTAPTRTTSLEIASPCPPPQMRSDWRYTPRGMTIAREPAPELAYFDVSAVRALHELQARLEGEHVVVSLLNPVPVALEGVELRVHYEGCFGKPGTMVETTEIGALAAGALASTRVARLGAKPDAPDGRRSFRAFSVQLVAKGEGVVIDLDVPLRSLGLEISCPER